MLAHNEGLGTINFFSNKSINIYPESSIFTSDEAIYQWKEKKKKENLDKTTSVSEKQAPDSFLTSLPGFDGELSLNPSQSSS